MAAVTAAPVAAASGVSLSISAVGTGGIPAALINNSPAGSRDEGENDGPRATSFDGLNHFDQRFANGQNQLSTEPANAAVCAGRGFVLESVAGALRVFDTSGNPLTGVVDLNTFYGYPAAFQRPAGPFGPNLNDPSCYYDSATQRWFHVVITLDRLAAGQFPGTNHVDIAVSKTSSPLGAWTVYQLPVENDGTAGTPDHGCVAGPSGVHQCLGDFPRIGADANGFYVTTNEYSFWGPRPFRAAQIYAFSKQQLAAGAASVSGLMFDTLNMVRGSQSGFTVVPARSPSQGEGESRGTAYFLSTNGAPEVNSNPGAGSNDLIVWSLSRSGSTSTLRNDVVTVGHYSMPPHSAQKVGSVPLAGCISTGVTTPMGLPCNAAVGVRNPVAVTEGQNIEAGDTRMQQVTFANGQLLGAIDTSMTIGGKQQAGLEWFAVRPRAGEDGRHSGVARQGYVGRADTTLSYPALAVSESGRGAISFSLMGPNDYPSAAYVSFDPRTGTGAIHIAAAGAGPVDGFTDYPAATGQSRMRWGDYSSAAADGSGVWMASEYVGQTCTLADFLVNTPASPFGTCNKTRASTANWDTRISRLPIGD